MKFKKPTYVWYALYLKVNCEKKVLAKLQEESIECYLPFSKALKQKSDIQEWVNEPLFPCYIFVRVSYNEFFKLLSIDGVLRYVSFGGQPQSIPDTQIKSIQALIEEKQEDLVITREHVAKGGKAEILFGPLKGIQGEIVQSDEQKRIVLRVEPIGCCIYANISADEIYSLQEDNSNKRLGFQTTFGKNLERNKKLVL